GTRRRGIRLVDVSAVLRRAIHSRAAGPAARGARESHLLDERSAAPSAVDERLAGQRSRAVRHRRRRGSRSARQPPVTVRHVARGRGVARGGRADADALRGHGERGDVEQRHGGRHRRRLPAPRGGGMRPAVAFALILAGCARDPAGVAAVDAAAGRAVVELLYATPYAPTHPFSRADSRWIEVVESESNGRLRIRPSWAGALMSSQHSLIELRHGVADIGLITPIYVKGGAHLIRTQSGFYSGVRDIEEQVALYYCFADRHPEFDRELAGLKVLAVQGGSLPGLITRERPVTKLDELKGMRIRVPTELLPVFQALGAD